MTQTMLERVAEAIDPDAWSLVSKLPDWAPASMWEALNERMEGARCQARAAIEALMEPSPAMLDAGRAELAAFGVSADPGDVFRAMLRGASTEAEGDGT